MTLPSGRTLRRLLAGLLLVAVLPVSFLREAAPRHDHAQRIGIEPLPLPPVAKSMPHLGAFRLEGVWRIASRNPMFGGYSALVRLNDGRFLAVSDRGYTLRFSPPGEAQGPVRLDDIGVRTSRLKQERDAEAAAYDPATGRVWIAWEGANAVTRLAPDLGREASIKPPAMRGWGRNSGAEAMTRLADGRFLILAEGFTGPFEDREHEALLFPGDPAGPGKPVHLRLKGPPEFSPTDMAQLPDGRVLIVMRRAVWPMPFRFAGRLALADPAAIRPGGAWPARTVAYLSSSLPVDNFEGIVAEPRADGRIAVWLISDDNGAVTQRTLLWKLVVDPKDL